MEYLLKVAAVVTIFYIIYKLFLQRDTFFESNRWFLIIGLISSLLIPFLVIPIYIEYTPVLFDNVVINGQVATETIEKPFNILDYLPLIYGLGVVFFLVRFFIQLLSLIKIIYKNKGIKKDGFVFIEAQNNTSPFSFFKWIVYNPETFSQKELKHIIEHEKTHAKQCHSVDILITQLFCVLLWFNPFMWLYNKDLKQNLEFIADKRTLNQYTCKKSYQYTLLKTSMPSHHMALSNHFYNSLIKKRIVMLHKSKSKKINQLKYALVIPFIAFFLMSFNTEEVLIQKSVVNSAEKKISETYIINKNTSDNELSDIESKITEKGGSFTYSTMRDSNRNIIDLQFEIIYKGTGNYKSEAPFKEVYFGTFLNGGIFIAENEEGVKKISENRMVEKNSQTPQSNLKLLDSEEFVISGTVTDINGKPIEKVMVQNGSASGVMTNHGGKYKIKANIGDELVFTYEGMQTQKIKVTKDETINVKLSEPIIVKGIQTNSGETPLYIINGKEVTEAIAMAINEEKIENFLTLKDETAIKVYGDKGKNGVVLITLKTPIAGEGLPFFIVDGEEMYQEEFSKITADDIETLNILKDKNSIKKYGDKAKNGVVIITTKK